MSTFDSALEEEMFEVLQAERHRLYNRELSGNGECICAMEVERRAFKVALDVMYASNAREKNESVRHE